MQFVNRKLSGIDIEKDKTSKNYQIPFFSTFCQNNDRLRGLQCSNAEGVGKLVVSVSFRYEISSNRKRKELQIDLRCQNFEVFVVFDLISVDFSKDFVLSSAIHSTTKKRGMHYFLEENITVFCFTNTSE